MAVMMGATVVGPRLLAADFGHEKNTEGALKSAAAAPHPTFSAEEIALLDEIGETIIPATDVPGAKAVGIGAFIAMMITDCYYPKEQAAFREGLRGLPAAFEAKYHEKFLDGSAANRTAFLNTLDEEQKAVTAKQAEREKFVHENASTEESNEPVEDVPHYFRMMKELTILGYFTSEIGSTQVLGWVEVPGRYDGNMPYKKGDKPGTDMRV